jgi:hypothetical protein
MTESPSELIARRLRHFRKAIREYRAAVGRSARFFLEEDAIDLPESALQNVTVFPNRNMIVKFFSKIIENPIVAELGTYRGEWAEFLLKQFRPNELHLFDLDFSLIRGVVASAKPVHLHAGDSSTMLLRMPEQYFDVIYIDGDHSYEGVKRDIKASILKLKKDGLLMFNDYTVWSPVSAIPYGVVRAVNDLAHTGWKFVAIGLNPNGYWDVALKQEGLN